MQTRSRGGHNLIHYLDHINRLQPRQPTTPATTPTIPPTPPAMADQQARPHVIGAGDAPNTHTQRQGIVPPAVPNNNFEIKSGLISMIQGNKFHGLPMEDPLDHLDEFDRLCGLTKINGVSEDGFKLRLFPFSLGDKAHQWEKSLPTGSITTWDECKKAFLTKFFSNARTARLKNQIAGFTQKNGETFCEAWERFKSYTAQCPHHGFSKATLLSTLYRGATPKARTLLDTASNGNFLNQDVEEGWDLVENFAQSDSSYSEEYDRSVRGSSEGDDRDRKELKALNEKLDKLLAQQKAIHFVHEEDQGQLQEGENDQSEEICYMQNQGGYRGYNNFKPNPNLSYRNTNVANPQDQVYPQQQQGTKPFVQNQAFAPRPALPTLNPPPGFVFQQQQPQPDIDIRSAVQQIIQSNVAAVAENRKIITDLRNTVDSNYTDLSNKFETLNSRLKYLENINASSSSTKQQGQLPGKAIQNPKDYANVNVVECTSPQHLPFKKRHVSYTGDSVIQEGGHLNQALGVFTAEEAAPEVQLDPLTRSSDRANTKPAKETPLGRHTRPSGRVKPPTLEEPPMSNLQVMLNCPYPQKYKKQILEEWSALVDKGVKYTERVMPLKLAYDIIPSNLPLFKERMMERIKAKELAEKELKQHEDIELKTTVEDEIVIKEKLNDPGSFTLPCSLNQTILKDALCDLGASVSIMPLSVAEELGYEEFKPSKLSLVLADRSVRKPHGMLENLPVRIGNMEVPTDFIVLEMNEKPKNPLILGRPFLASAGAIIDVKGGKIELKVGKESVLRFDINTKPTKPPTEGYLLSIDEVEQENSDVFMEEFRAVEEGPLPSYIPLEVEEEPITLQEESMDWVNHQDYGEGDGLSDVGSETGSSPPGEEAAQDKVIRNLREAIGYLIEEVRCLKTQLADLKSNAVNPWHNQSPKEIKGPRLSRAFRIATRASSFNIKEKNQGEPSKFPSHPPF